MTWRQKFNRWWLGLVEGFIQGGATAVKAFVGASAASALAPTLLTALTLHQLIAVFLTAGFWHCNDYLANNPLPVPDLSVTTTTVAKSTTVTEIPLPITEKSVTPISS